MKKAFVMLSMALFMLAVTAPTYGGKGDSKECAKMQCCDKCSKDCTKDKKCCDKCTKDKSCHKADSTSKK